MKAERVQSWLTLGANVGVVIGLFLVAFQIRQDAELTRAQLFSDATNSRREWNQGLMGENPMEVVAKSIERPHELSLAELQIMDLYFIGAINELRRLDVLRQAGLDVEAEVENFESFYFGSNFGKAWFAEYGGGERESQTIRERISEVEPNWVVTFFDTVLARLGEDSGQSLSRDRSAQ